MRFNFGQQGCTSLVYDGVNLADTFEVVSISLPLLPTLTAVTMDAADRPGLYFASRKVGTRTVKVRLRLDAESRCPLDIFQAWSSVSEQVCKSEPRPLHIGEGRHVNAMLTGETQIEDKGHSGEVELTFTCFDPYVYGQEHEAHLSGTTTVSVSGGAYVFPVLDIEATSTTVKVANADTGDYVRVPNVSVGAKLSMDMERQTVVNALGEYVPVDLMSDFFPLPVGDTPVKVDGCTATLRYRERSL